MNQFNTCYRTKKTPKVKLLNPFNKFDRTQEKHLK